MLNLGIADGAKVGLKLRPCIFWHIEWVACDPRGGGLDQTPPVGSTIFNVLGEFLTSCTCIVKSRKRGCFHKSTTESGCGEVI